MNPKSRSIIRNKDYEAIEKLMSKLRKENKTKQDTLDLLEEAMNNT